ncbi:MAG: ATP-binding cassette domain-containing protein, partial [Lachnospiraceae bacterium]|nr:ATP-binding cassette domain-containing protein [Lachnospiraceae bacterium]
EISKILQKLGLEAFANRHPMSLSGGQKQRTAIAGAVVSDRELVVFDEPTSGLDLKHMAKVGELLLQLRRMGRTVLVITHDYELIACCCSYVLHLEHGQVQEQYVLDEEGMGKLKDFFKVS